MIIITLKLDDFKDVESMKKYFFDMVDKFTPDHIKNNPIIDLSEKGKFTFRLTKDLVEKYNLEEWLRVYKKEAQISTAGIRGVQNVKYYWDTRFTIHQLGVVLATLGKALVLKEKIKNKQIQKIASSEVRYNSHEYVELISRIQAAQGIKTHRPLDDMITTIWMTSFMIFINDYDGGEYVTSSHAISRKTATKDLDDQGSQFLPEMSLAFVAKIEEIIKEAKENPDGYLIEFSEAENPLIVRDFNGFDEYTDYLKNGVGNKANISLIEDAVTEGFTIMVDCVGGSMHYNASNVFDRLGILKAFDWCNIGEDPFFHSVGKIWQKNEKGEEELIDLSCDASIPIVVDNFGYDLMFKDKPLGYVILVADQDADRLITAQIESADRESKLKELGIHTVKLTDDKILAVYSPNQSFFFTMDYQMKALKKAGLWDDHPRFIIKTTASANYWNFWADSNDIKVVDVPVGFKEIAAIMKKVEKQIKENPAQSVKLHDIYGNMIDLGADPRMVFAGEESGGMITGPEELIKSKGGRVAISMREKSAPEAVVIQTALCADLYLRKKTISEYFEQIFEENHIKEKYDMRVDVLLYNENEPDPEKMKKEKEEGEVLRDKIDDMLLSLSIGLRRKIITLDHAAQILAEMFPSLDFSDLESVLFVGDGTYIRFSNMFIELRKSGTDAKFKIYGGGSDLKRIKTYLKAMEGFKGDRTPLFEKHIPEDFFKNIQDTAREIYFEFEDNV